MMEVESISDIIKKAESLTKSPEKYLSAQAEAALEIRELTKKLYDFNKLNESCKKGNLEVLEELVVDNLDEEQIWQQIELQNSFVCKEFVTDIALFLVKKNKLVFGANGVDDKEDEEELNDGIESSEDEEDELELGEEEEEEGGGEELDRENSVDGEDGSIAGHSDDDDDDEEEDSEDIVNGKTTKMPPKPKRTSIVDDKFFKLSEMEQFLEKEENKKDNSDEDDIIDYFQNYSSDSNDEEEEGPKYDDFFDQPEDGSVKKRRRKQKDSEGFEDFPVKKKKVKFAVDERDDGGDDEDESDEGDNDMNDFDDEDDEDDSTSAGKKKSDYISTFEARQERLKSRIKALEEEALKEKPWQLKGEVTAATRPQNSLLEEYVEFDTAIRPPPVITEKTTLKLEDIIKQRIKDKAWDDVERKIKPVEDPKEYKKRLVLNQEKSKLSLAQIYEQEYLKQKEAKSENIEEKPEIVPDEHLEIDKMMGKLFTKLDALSNFHFTPRMASAEIKIVSNAPAVTVEEVAPIATSDATLLAPEEVKSKTKGDLIGKSERTKTDKKRERRLKKKRQHIKQKESEKKEKVKPDKVKDFSTKNKKAKKMIKKLGRNVTQLNDSGDGKYIRSSNAFFSKLQDEAKSVIKQKSKSTKLEKDQKLDIKKLKL